MEDEAETRAWRETVGAEHAQALLAGLPELKAIDRELVPALDAGGLLFECRSRPETVANLAHVVSLDAQRSNAASSLVTGWVQKHEPIVHAQRAPLPTHKKRKGRLEC